MNNIEYRKECIRKQLKDRLLTPYSSLSIVILNESDVCNRKCVFCPRGNGFKNIEGKPKFMSSEVLQKLVDQLGDKFIGCFNLSGFGEPTLNPDIEEHLKILRTLPNLIRLYTNPETEDHIRKALNLDVDYVVISCYGKEDVERATKVVEQENVKDKDIFIKDINDEELDTFNNKAGNVKEVDKSLIPKTCCNIPMMKIDIDTDGDVLLCCSDWKREMPFGNIKNENIWNIWINKMRDYRIKLLTNHRDQCLLCSRCTAKGDLYGEEFKRFWKYYYEA